MLQLQTKSLDHEELIHRVFTGAAATSKNAWTLGKTRNQLEVEGESDSADFSTHSNELGVSKTADLMKSTTINTSGSERKMRHSSVRAMQKKRMIGVEAFATSIDDLVNSVKTQSKELTVIHVVGGHSVTMAEAVERLYEIQGLHQTNPLLHFGILLMEMPNNREMEQRGPLHAKQGSVVDIENSKSVSFSDSQKPSIFRSYKQGWGLLIINGNNGPW
ncbi:hypothetical protein LOK49_LG05G02018 [Camellia lanceoleosa]|uniref:Uncharacterized protein n=1 Tax=Camellia lanceoleosa TaxID=1840588 RepID=A0ACC0HTZ7_9ERIC|nr:hypothetical protein LOK49_LG05G02018 [Camellia lanceoleosa]